MLFVYGNGACVGYMVFIGDFIPAIIALMLPEVGPTVEASFAPGSVQSRVQ